MGQRMADEGEKKSTFKIGEVCRLADVQPYVLRYWETEFPSLTPAKGGGGQRTYTQREVDTILRIKALLYTDGFTIAGAKKKLETELSQPDIDPGQAAAQPAPKPRTKKSAALSEGALEAARNELRELLRLLE